LSLSALLKCGVFFPMTTQDFHSCNTLRHCERSEAIHAGTLDCFTLQVRNDGSAGRLHQLPLSLSALLKCSVFFPMTTQDLHSCNTFRHCERSEAIHAGTPDCFTLRVRNDAGGGTVCTMHPLRRLHCYCGITPLKCSVFFPMTFVTV
jgi:hypothetical protein